MLGAGACTISLVNEPAGELVLCAQRGLRFSHLGMRIPLGQGPVGRVASTGEVAIIDDIAKDAYLASSSLAREPFKAMALIPMHSRGKVVGVLGVLGHNAGDCKVALGAAIADQAGCAVENARQYQALKKHAIQVEKANARLQETDKQKDEFIQNASHEMRTPLTILKGHVLCMIDGDYGAITDVQRNSLEIVAHQAEQLGRLVDDILTLEAVSPETLVIEPVNLGELARMALEGCRPAASAAGIELRADIPDDLPMALADSARINEVLDNLLSNAVKFSRNGTITVQVREEGDWLRIAVSDTGVGIPSEKLARLFERFYQVDGPSRRRYGGLGLGLAIVKRIIQAHKGSVGVESKVGEGTRFFFTLPRVPR